MSSYLGRNTCCRGRGAAPHALLRQWLGVLGFADSVHDCTHMPHMERQVGQNPGRRGRNTCSRYRWTLGPRRPVTPCRVGGRHAVTSMDGITLCNGEGWGERSPSCLWGINVSEGGLEHANTGNLPGPGKSWN